MTTNQPTPETARPFHIMHLRTGPWHISCGHRNARSAADADQFDAYPVEHKCLRCAAKRTKILARRAKVAARPEGGAA